MPGQVVDSHTINYVGEKEDVKITCNTLVLAAFVDFLGLGEFERRLSSCLCVESSVSLR